MFHAEQRFRRKGETKMTNSQEIESQLAQYAGKLNAIERDRAQAGTDIDHGVAEVKRLEVLVELGEVQEAELVNTRRKIAKAGEQAQAANERLTLARRAQAELQERLAAARAEEATERWQARLKEYGGAATEILRLLEQAKMQLDRMEDAGAGFWRDGFRGVSKASQSAVKIWPEQLRHDLELLRARYGDGENE
jgi:phosphoglycolate phosphatase-like HAD superfamily hydrolase